MCFELATFGNALGVRADFIPEHFRNGSGLSGLGTPKVSGSVDSH